MKQLLVLLLAGVFNLTFFCIYGQTETEKYHRATIYFGDKTIRDIQAASIDVSHSHVEKGCCLISDFSDSEIGRLTSMGFEVSITITDVSKYYEDQNSIPKNTASPRNRSICKTRPPMAFQDPINFSLGTMGGYHKYSEILDHLDMMYLLYPNLISFREPISDFRTYHGRPIFYVRISNNPNVDQPSKPKVLHTALHHAREPMSVTQMLYFMWYLLENYDKSDYVKSLVDASEIFFVPILNPDGYRFNEDNHPNGGGMFRKNRRLMGSGARGVDLNRNYDFMWGVDNFGSSPNQWDETYRGPSPASEPEVRAIKWLCRKYPFDIALNHHSFGNALLYPFGFAEVSVPDAKTFFALSHEMTKNNQYDFGRPWEVASVGYAVNGGSDDWMYGDIESKAPIFAFTPEIGSFQQGFWPHQSDIIPLCRDMVYTNLMSLALLHNHGFFTEMSPDLVGLENNKLIFNVQRNGLRGGVFQVRVQPLHGAIQMPTTVQNIQLWENSSDELQFHYDVIERLPLGSEIKFAVQFDMGHIVLLDTIVKVYQGMPKQRFNDQGLGIDNWFVEGLSTWDVDEQFYFTAPSCLSDSPGGNYRPSASNTMRTRIPINLRNAHAAYLSFRTRWAIEPGRDFAWVKGSSNGFSFQPLCGKFTKIGNDSHGIAASGMPIYDGFQNQWVLETMDLSNYLGGDFFIEINLTSDHSIEYEGFFIDDIQVIAFTDEPSSSVSGSEIIAPLRSKIYPNPAANQAYIHFQDEVNSYFNQIIEVSLISTLGQVVYEWQTTMSSDGLLNLDVSQIPPGIYIYQVSLQNKHLARGRLSIQR